MSRLRPHFALHAIFLFHLLLHRTCNAKAICTSSCRDIHNISHPFRLNSDPKFCGDRKFELICENDFTVLYLESVKYYVRAINYNNRSIRLVDADVEKNDYCSIPRHSLRSYQDPFYYDDLTYPYWNGNMSSLLKNNVYFYTMSLAFISCENRVNSPLYVNSSTCSSSSKGYSYVKVGATVASQLADSCRIDLIYPAVLPFIVNSISFIGYNNISFKDIFDAGMVPIYFAGLGYAAIKMNVSNISYKDIHESMVYGFELQWYPPYYFHETFLKVLVDLIYSIDYDIDNILLFLSGGNGETNYNGKRHRLIGKLLYPPFNRGDPTWFCYASRFIRHVVAIIVAIFVLYRILLFILGAPWIIALLIYKWRRRHLSAYNNVEEFLQIHNNLMPIRYSYSEIKKITKCFKEKLGEGGYGSVYKGKLRSSYFAAVKMLDKSKANGQEFINEVGTIGRIHHANIVQLIGFCVERSKRALVYEFMPNGSLDKYLFTQGGNMHLSIKKMYEISLGVARGIEYLHEGCQMQILHFDIKPHNILLDEKFNPKISDFGLAKLYKINNSIVSLTTARGTIGYMAPELFYRSIGGVSYKADVYSFGMLLMEMAGRRKNLNTLVSNSSQLYFPSWVHNHFSKGNDIELEGTTENEKIITKKMIIVALWCIQLNPSDRPSMHKVIEMLEGDVDDLQMPPKPSFGPAEMSTEKGESSTNQISLIDSHSDYANSISLVIDAGIK